MATKWLSENGLSLLWEKITNLFAKKTDLDSYAKKTDVDGRYLPTSGGYVDGDVSFGEALQVHPNGTDNGDNVVSVINPMTSVEYNLFLSSPSGAMSLEAWMNNERMDTAMEFSPLNNKFYGNANTATKLATPVKINGVPFDGSKDITIENGGGASGDYLPLSGGVMTGNISYMSGGEVYTPVTFYPGDQYGGAVLVGAGGRTIIGAGESAYGLYTALGGSPTTEDMWVAADSAVYIVTNCNTIGNRVATTFKEDGSMYLPSKGAVVASNANGGSWITGRSNATVKNTGIPNSASYYPSVSMKTPTGNWSMGILGEQLYFSYDTDTNFNANSNTHSSVYIDSSSNFSGNAASATKLLNTWTINGTNFNGTGSITTANWGTARTLTIGSTGKSVNGSTNVSWTLNEIGAAAASHTHAYLSTSGGTVSGNLTVTGSVLFTGAAAHGTSLPSSGSAGQVFFLHS